MTVFTLDYDQVCEPNAMSVHDHLIREAVRKGMRPPFEMRQEGSIFYIVEADRRGERAGR